MQRSQQTRTVETKLKEGHSVSSVARTMGVSRQRVQQIKRRMGEDFVTCTETVNGDSVLKSVTIHLTASVHDALVEACGVANRRSPEEPISIQEYVEECVISRVVELGLLRRNKRR